MQFFHQKFFARTFFFLPIALCLIMPTRVLANNFDIAFPKFVEAENATSNELRSKLRLAYIKEFGTTSFMAMTLCLEASEDNKHGKTTALTTNFQHKEEMIVYWRNLYSKRAELGGIDHRGKELNTVNSIISLAREYCPSSR